MKLIDAPFEITTAGWQVEANETAGSHSSENDEQQWIWVFERLKSADINLSFSEKVKFFCEAANPEEVENFIEAQLQEQAIIPLAA
ncbi:MAG: hypothetical protein H0X66_16440 [Verrucomicrobia bacterium]|nr:hypothetical protein [Verrucomicrobiota bacterium]